MSAFFYAVYAVEETGPKRPNERARSTLPGWRKIQQGAEGGPFFLHRQPFRWRLRLRQSLTVSSAPCLSALALDGFLLGDRRVLHQLVEVGDDPGQHPKHAGAVERHVFRLGIGLG